MKVFGISDLHLSAAGDKPMDVFGPEWEGHADRLAASWRRLVAPDDLVLIPGDLSWGMRLDEARPDLDFIGALPGTKYFIRGNHDYWLSGPTRVRAVLVPTMKLIRFDAAVERGVGICGVRGWPWPGHADYSPERDDVHWKRAIARLRLSLDALSRLRWDMAVAMFHYAPRPPEGDTELTEMIRRAGVRRCVYGHLHGPDAAAALEGEVDGVTYRCVSADKVGFAPALLFEHPAPRA